MKPKHPPAQLVKGNPSDRALYDPRLGSYVKVRDAQDGGEHPVSSREVELFLGHRQSAMRPAKVALIRGLPSPGGLGAGVSYQDSLMHFRDSSAVYYYLVAPPTIGPQASATLLYMTSSNAAWKGCEALLSFFDTEQFRCVFRIWDWAHPDMPGGGKFVKGYSYNELSDYLIPYSFGLNSGEQLDTVCLYVVNVTRNTGGTSFQNEVYLHNHATGTRDLMWSYAFDWADRDAQPEFWWGPIFETFPNPGAPRYTVTNPVGFDAFLIVQDGQEYQPTDANCKMTLPQNDGLVEIYRSVGSNSGLVCGS